MAAGYIPLPGYNPGGPLNFEPLQNALAGYQNTRFRNQQLEQQAQNALMQQQHWQAENTRADETQGWQRQNQTNALMDRSTKQTGQLAQAADQETDPARRAALYQGAQQIDPSLAQGPYADVTTGPRLAAARAGLLPDPNKVEYGKNGQLIQNPDGSFSTVMYRSNGEVKVAPLPSGSAPARGVTEVNTETGTQIINKATGQPVREVPRNIAAAEEQKVLGKNTGEIAVSRPKIEAALNGMQRKTTLVEQDIDHAIGLAENALNTGVLGNIQSYAPGTPGYDLWATLNTIKANIGFGELQEMRNNSPTGGALGNVSDAENLLLQSLEGALQQGQSKDQQIRNLQRVKKYRREVLEERRNAFNLTYKVQGVDGPTDKQMGPPPGSEVPSFRGSQPTTAVNPQTGHKIMWDGSRWVDAQ